MKKKEFLDELRIRLKGLPNDDLNERISFYSEMIDDRVSEGKTEDEAVSEIGSVDEVVRQIASETPLVSLVKEKIKPKRSLRAWEVILLVLGFPLWFPLALTILILYFVSYILIWVLIIVVYALFISLFASGGCGIFAFFYSIFDHNMQIQLLGLGLLGFGLSIFAFFLVIKATKFGALAAKNYVIGIKTLFFGRK